MTEPKPYWIGGAKDGRFSCQLIPLIINGEPLSTKQLHELITSQAMTIDRLLGEIAKRDNDIKVLEYANDKFLDRIIELEEKLK